ncbi:TonB-dependent Receptor Plug Domain [Spirosomataceae bacterium TFI 002]|nr:TonB-dependent Receptor Plug Domain [Spirosomataceae bacterium TFI 002]
MRNIICFIILLYAFGSNAQGNTVSGFIKDKSSGESIIGATVLDLNTGSSTISNNYGFYSLNTTLTVSKLKISSVGYKTLEVEVNQGGSQNFELEIIETNLNEVVVISNDEKRTLDKIPLGVTAIPIQRLKAIPVLFGEADILKALSLTPGVSIGNEGTAGILVRGGTPDQNLMLLDESPVYNVSHLFGLVSVFNPEAVKSVTLYKSSFPARYGGRLSSVIDIVTREGNSKKRNLEFGIGLINSRLIYEGPLLKNKTNSPTFFIGARVSNLSLILSPNFLRYKTSDHGNYFNYSMFDLNIKLNQKFKNNSQLFWSTYVGNDFYNAKDKNGPTVESGFNLNWGNVTSTLRYIAPLNQKLFMKSALGYTSYKYGIFTEALENKERVDFLKSVSKIEDYYAKVGFEFYASNNLEFQLGSDLISHSYKPINLTTTYGFDQSNNVPSINALESGTYFESKVKFLSFAELTAGLRYATFGVKGLTYPSWEPRLSTAINISKTGSLRFGYSKMKQFIHLLSSNSVGLPNDLWVPSSDFVKPQDSEQFSVGFSQKIAKGLSFSIEAYSKSFANLIDYKDGTNFLVDTEEFYEDKLELGGIGKAQGVEFFLDKNEGKFTGWLAYSLATNRRQFDNINDGEWFAANFDRQHNVSLVGNYKFNERIDLSGNWIFQSGSPVSVPIASMKNVVQGSDYPTFIYGDRNNFRTPAYHRMDLCVNFKKETYRNNLRTWTIGVYNAYNRQNPFYLDVRWGVNNTSTDPRKVEGWNNNLVKRSVIPFLPFINYSLKFK